MRAGPFDSIRVECVERLGREDRGCCGRSIARERECARRALRPGEPSIGVASTPSSGAGTTCRLACPAAVADPEAMSNRCSAPPSEVVGSTLAPVVLSRRSRPCTLLRRSHRAPPPDIVVKRTRDSRRQEQWTVADGSGRTAAVSMGSSQRAGRRRGRRRIHPGRNGLHSSPRSLPDGCCAAAVGEGGFGVESVGAVAGGGQQLSGDVGADAGRGGGRRPSLDDQPQCRRDRPLLAERGCLVHDGVRLRTLADVVAYLDHHPRALMGPPRRVRRPVEGRAGSQTASKCHQPPPPDLGAGRLDRSEVNCEEAGNQGSLAGWARSGEIGIWRPDPDLEVCCQRQWRVLITGRRCRCLVAATVVHPAL